MGDTVNFPRSNKKDFHKPKQRDAAFLEKMKKDFYEKDGILYWNRDTKRGIKKDCAVGTFITSPKTGAKAISFRFNFKSYGLLVSHVVWFLNKDKWPEKEIDHINNNGDDNRISNLRECSRSQNICNTQSKKKYKGVFYCTRSGKYYAQLQKNYKVYYGGSYKTPKEASAAYLKLAQEHHKEFLRV